MSPLQGSWFATIVLWGLAGGLAIWIYWGDLRRIHLRSPFYVSSSSASAETIEPESDVDTTLSDVSAQGQATELERGPTAEQREAVEVLRILYGSASGAAEVAEAILYRLVRTAIRGDRPTHYLGLFVKTCILEAEQSSRTELVNKLELINKTHNENLFGIFYLNYVKVRGWIKRLGELPQDQREWTYNHSDQYADWWEKDLRFHERFKEITYRSDMEALRRVYHDNGWGPDLPPPQNRIAIT